MYLVLISLSDLLNLLAFFEWFYFKVRELGIKVQTGSSGTLTILKSGIGEPLNLSPELTPPPPPANIGEFLDD